MVNKHQKRPFISLIQSKNNDRTTKNMKVYHKIDVHVNGMRIAFNLIQILFIDIISNRKIQNFQVVVIWQSICISYAELLITLHCACCIHFEIGFNHYSNRRRKHTHTQWTTKTINSSSVKYLRGTMVGMTFALLLRTMNTKKNLQ